MDENKFEELIKRYEKGLANKNEVAQIEYWLEERSRTGSDEVLKS